MPRCAPRGRSRRRRPASRASCRACGRSGRGAAVPNAVRQSLHAVRWCAHAREDAVQPLHVERLHQVVGRAAPQCVDRGFEARVAGGQHHFTVRTLRQRIEQIHPVAVRQHEIAQHEIGDASTRACALPRASRPYRTTTAGCGRASRAWCVYRHRLRRSGRRASRLLKRPDPCMAGTATDAQRTVSTSFRGGMRRAVHDRKDKRSCAGYDA